jgi:hypothetical protein
MASSSQPPSSGRKVIRLAQVMLKKGYFRPELLGRVYPISSPKIKPVRVIMGVDALKLESLCRRLKIDVADICAKGSRHVNDDNMTVNLDPDRTAALLKSLNHELGTNLRVPEENEADILLAAKAEMQRLRKLRIGRFLVHQKGRYGGFRIPIAADLEEYPTGLIVVDDGTRRKS